MKSLFLIPLLALCSCTSTNVQTPTITLKRVSFMQKVAIPELTIATNGTATLQGYSNDGGAAAMAEVFKGMATIMEKLAQGGVKGLKGGL